MVGIYEILDPEFADTPSPSSVLRNVRLRVGDRSLDHISRYADWATDEKTLDRVLGGSVLNECYVDVTLPRLRELGDDTEERNRFMLRRSKFLYR